MKRNTLNALVDGVLAISGTGLVVTGLFMAFVLPPGTNRSHTLWTLTRHQWGEIHLWLAYAMLGVGLIHVALHWTWIVATARRAVVGRGGGRPSLRLRVVSGCVAGVLFLTLVGGIWTLAANAVTERQSSPHERDTLREPQPPGADTPPADTDHGTQQRRRTGQGARNSRSPD